MLKKIQDERVARNVIPLIDGRSVTEYNQLVGIVNDSIDRQDMEERLLSVPRFVWLASILPDAVERSLLE